MNANPLETTVVSILANRLIKAGPPGLPINVSVGASTALILPENPRRTGLVLTNCHATQRVSFYLVIPGAQLLPGWTTPTAIIDSGITLFASGGVWEMDAETFTTGAIYAIASGASTLVAIQEFTSATN